MKIFISVLIALILLFSFPLHAQSTFKNKGKRSSLVDVVPVKIFNIAEKTNVIGRLVPLNPTIISSKINQEILKIHFKIGDDVKINDVLFTLDSKDILRNIEQIIAEIKYEQQTLELLRKQLELRYSKVINAKNLRKQNIITQDNMDNLNISYLQNRQQIEERK